MDAWKPFAVRAHCRDAVQQWARLEGKSLTTTDDLARRYDAAAPSTDWKGALALVARLSAIAVDFWLQLTRR